MGRRVLVIDDSEIQLFFETETLKRAGFEVCAVSTIAAFEAALANFTPDIVLTDFHMPDMTGAELCRMLKKSLPTSRIPVVLFSTLPEEELAQVARACGADSHLSKHDGLSRLADELESLCQQIVF